MSKWDEELAELEELRQQPLSPSIVCRCNLVEEQEILSLLASGATLAEITRRTGAGATCQSCVPLLRRLAGGPS